MVDSMVICDGGWGGVFWGGEDAGSLGAGTAQLVNLGLRREDAIIDLHQFISILGHSVQIYSKRKSVALAPTLAIPSFHGEIISSAQPCLIIAPWKEVSLVRRSSP